jgi:hypothetical protein
VLVPDLAAGATGLVAPLLAACDKVVAGLLARRPRLIVVLGSGPETRTWPDIDTGTLAGYGGVPTSIVGSSSSENVSLPSQSVTPGTDDPAVRGGTPGAGVVADRAAMLPLSLSIGRWLLARAGWTGPVLLQALAADSAPDECRRVARQLAAAAGPDVVWLVLGDGSNRRGPRSPGHDDPRAEGFDAMVAQAFADGDPAALLALDPGLAAELGAAGRPVWQLLAAAVTDQRDQVDAVVAAPVVADPVVADPTAAGSGMSASADWTSIEANLLYDDAPFGVEYIVADWAPRS